jgi:tetratricopeptide (TPR) repeat protein
MRIKRITRLAAAITIALSGAFGAAWTCAAPFVPANETEVVDKLPGRVGGAGATSARERQRTQALLKANGHNLDIALHIAQLNIRRARSEADPRYLGQAQAALAPWWNQENPPVAVLVQRATIRQGLHQFSAARVDLDNVVAREPGNAQAWLTLATVQQVMGDDAAARKSCNKLAALTIAPIHAACVATVDGSTGRARDAAALLAKSLQSGSRVNRELNVWVATLQAELAERTGRVKDAERFYRLALSLDKRDAYANAAYADFLLDENRSAAVLDLIAADTDSDLLMLRRAIAAQKLKRPDAGAIADVLEARYEAARSREERLHLREEARFVLHVRHRPLEGLKLAVANWQTQKEPADLRILLEAAGAARDRDAAKPALAWVARTQIEGRVIAQLAKEVKRL